MTPSKKRGLDQLADALLARHLQESWPEPSDSIPNWFDNGPPPRYEDSLRTVAVVGAGASVPMMAIADDLATELEEELDGDGRDHEVELDRLENVYGLHRNHFETRLTALCRTPENERKVRERISESYRYRHPSLLTYELLAHLLHHRFLDAIISFNFDELLDQAIDDELGPNEYIRVVTERDCGPVVPASVPLYIKMHGTASEPDSLRFTRERYYWTPRSIIELVERQFEVEHLVVLNLGFSLNSFDFQYLLRKPDQLQIYHFDPKRLKSDVLKEVSKQRKKFRLHQKKPRPDEYDKPEIVDFSIKRKPSSEFLPNLLDELVSVLQEHCEEHSSVPVCWRSTLRHRAVVEPLKGLPLGTKDQYTGYLRRRAILEFTFAAARGRGVLSIASMVDDRCGRYYDLYRQQSGGEGDSWLKLCSEGGLQESDARPDTFEVLLALRQDQTKAVDENVHQLRLADAEKLAAHVAVSLNIPAQHRADTQTLLTETIRFLQQETDIEVHSRDDRICSKTFAKPVILKTFTALRGWTRKMLEHTPDYNELWAISEVGDWLVHEETGMLEKFEERTAETDPPRHNKKPVRLLTAFDSDLGKYERQIDALLLPWGRHNRHMTVLCKDEQPRAAIYFVRRLRAPTVTPVYLTNQKDLRRVAQAFITLWKEAGAYSATL